MQYASLSNIDCFQTQIESARWYQLSGLDIVVTPTGEGNVTAEVDLLRYQNGTMASLMSSPPPQVRLQYIKHLRALKSSLTQMLLKLVLKGTIVNKKALVRVMDWRLTCDKQPELKCPTQYGVTRPQWVNSLGPRVAYVRRWSGSAIVLVMAWFCLLPSRYLDQCRLIINSGANLSQIWTAKRRPFYSAVNALWIILVWNLWPCVSFIQFITMTS